MKERPSHSEQKIEILGYLKDKVPIFQACEIPRQRSQWLCANILIRELRWIGSRSRLIFVCAIRFTSNCGCHFFIGWTAMNSSTDDFNFRHGHLLVKAQTITAMVIHLVLAVTFSLFFFCQFCFFYVIMSLMVPPNDQMIPEDINLLIEKSHGFWNIWWHMNPSRHTFLMAIYRAESINLYKR